MVDFKKKLAGKPAKKLTNPIELYNSLDREHDKGPLRPAQEDVLTIWYTKEQNKRDVIVKLHTGQGKTLVGLLLLQSRLNSGKGPVVYLCPDNFLIEQTRIQAKQFGIKTCSVDNELPDEFIEGKTILVTSAQKMFNGFSKFGLNNQSIQVDTVLMDDAHACSDRIRESCRIQISSDEQPYHELKTLLSSEIEEQGVGTYADIENKKHDSLLPVPYWAWIDREKDIARILSEHSDKKSIRFAWPLIKDMLPNCQCTISGSSIEIEPYIAPLSSFGSYWNADHRVFMSATVTDDAFLVKGLSLSSNTILNPITYSEETWSGEKMVLIPPLIHESLTRGYIIKGLGSPNDKRNYGVAALVPSFKKSKDWDQYGAKVVDKDTVSEAIGKLKDSNFQQTLVLVNRYDGIDLPDSSCRILIFDSSPYAENLSDLYQESCRPRSEATLMRVIRSIEQGMGRSVRGEKDYSIIIVVGTGIVRLLREKNSRKYLSPQMSKQIEIGLDIAEMAKEELVDDVKPINVFTNLVNQCLQRDAGWKAYYTEQMENANASGPNREILEAYEVELRAESSWQAGDYQVAADTLQSMLDSKDLSNDDTGWHLQQMARYNYRNNNSEFELLQKAAHKKNRLLLKPRAGVSVARLTIVSQKRTENIANWLKAKGSYSDLNIAITDILGQLSFGTKADRFEAAFNELSFALGFAGERPDKEWKEGPDNLWALDDQNYLVIECKSEVKTTRLEINKSEAEQMNRSSAWFTKHYSGLDAQRVIIIPAYKVQSAAHFVDPVRALCESELKKFRDACHQFFKEFESHDFNSLSQTKIQALLNSYMLDTPSILEQYTRKIKNF